MWTTGAERLGAGCECYVKGLEGRSGGPGLLGAGEDGACGGVGFDAALVGEVDLEAGGVVGREGLEEGCEVVGGGVWERCYQGASIGTPRLAAAGWRMARVAGVTGETM